MAAPLIAWLEDQHWDVYQEVQLCQYSQRADIVARQDRLIWIIEMKRSLSMSAMAQARRIMRDVHFTSVAVASAGRGHGRNLAFDTLRWLGIGCLMVHPDSVTDQIAPRLNRRPLLVSEWRDALRPEHKTWGVAGNAEAQYWSPYRETCRSVAKYVADHPGALARDVIEHVTHHYRSDATARCCIVRWANAGKIPRVRVERDGRCLRFYPDSTP